MFKKIALLTFISTCCTVSAEEFNNSFEGREWEFLQYRFQTKIPGADILKTLGATIGVFGGTIFLFDKILAYNDIEFRGNNADTGVLSAFWLGGITFLGSLFYYYNKARINTEIRFVKNWPEYKKYTPVCFYQAFEELFEQYQSEGETKSFRDKIDELIKIINRAIFNRTVQKDNTVHLIYVPN